MKIIRVRNPIGIEYMKDYFIDSDVSKDDLCQSLKREVSNNLNNTFILQVWDGEELNAFLIAFNLPAQPHVFIYQAWAKAEVPTEISDRVFLRLLLWTDSLEKKEVRMETTGEEESFARRWGFKKYSTIMSFELTEGYETAFMNRLRKDVESKINDSPKKGISSDAHVGRIEKEKSNGQNNKTRDNRGGKADPTAKRD